MEELGEQIMRRFTAQDALALQWDDHRSDSNVVRYYDPEPVMGSVQTAKGDITELDVGMPELAEPLYGLQHDYGQARVCLGFFKEYDLAVQDMGDSIEAFLKFEVPVPDIPRYEPRYVNSSNEPRKFEAPLMRADFTRIMTSLGLVAPQNANDGTIDPVMAGWSTAGWQNGSNQVAFLGRAQVPMSNAVYLRFNPLTAAGAAMVQSVVHDKENHKLSGKYNVRGTLYPFTYELFAPEGKKRYIVSPDDWVARLGIKSFELMAYDLVGDHHFWRFGTPIYAPRQKRNVPVRDRLVPFSYRYIDYDPKKTCYEQKSLRQDDHTQEDGYVMHAGSSLAHKVEMHPGIEVLGEYAYIEPVSEGQPCMILYEYRCDQQPTGIFSLSQELSKTMAEPARWTLGARMAVTYAEGTKNSIVFKHQGHQCFVYRSKHYGVRSVPAPGSKEVRVNVRDYPLCGIMTNPRSSKVFLSGDYFKLEGAPVRKAFTTHFLHPGIYTNMEGSVALEGMDIFDYVMVHRPFGRTRALYEACGAEWAGIALDDDLACTEADAVGNIHTPTEEAILKRLYDEFMAY